MSSVNWLALWESHRLNLAAVLAAALGIVLLAFFFPLPSASWQAPRNQAGQEQSEPLALNTTDLAAFRTMDRWGKSVEELEEEERKEREEKQKKKQPKKEEKKKQDTHQRFGVLGVVKIGDTSYTLFRNSEGEMEQLELGGITPGGRELFRVNEGGVMLKDEEGRQVAVRLFPLLKKDEISLPEAKKSE